MKWNAVYTVSYLRSLNDHVDFDIKPAGSPSCLSRPDLACLFYYSCKHTLALPDLPKFLLIPLIFATAFVGGALWGTIAG